MKQCQNFISTLKKEEPSTKKAQIIVIGTGGTFQSAEMDDGKMAPE